MRFFWQKKSLLPAVEQEKVVAAIQEAEKHTTGEIRVYMERHCNNVDAMDRARQVFHKLGMEKTERRNAVLIYMAIDDRQFAIIGDKEIYEKAGGPVFWESAAELLKTYLRDGQTGAGVGACVAELGRALAQHFPYDPAITKNELPDEIVFGK